MKILENIKPKLTIFAEFICKSFPFAAGSWQQKMKNILDLFQDILQRLLKAVNAKSNNDSIADEIYHLQKVKRDALAGNRIVIWWILEDNKLSYLC